MSPQRIHKVVDELYIQLTEHTDDLALLEHRYNIQLHSYLTYSEQHESPGLLFRQDLQP